MSWKIKNEVFTVEPLDILDLMEILIPVLQSGPSYLKMEKDMCRQEQESSMISMALTFGAPDNVPAGRTLISALIGFSSSLKWKCSNQTDRRNGSKRKDKRRR